MALVWKCWGGCNISLYRFEINFLQYYSLWKSPSPEPSVTESSPEVVFAIGILKVWSICTYLHICSEVIMNKLLDYLAFNAEFFKELQHKIPELPMDIYNLLLGCLIH